MDIPDDQRGMRIFATVGAIIEREKDGETEIVLQVREKRNCEEHKKRYNGTFEMPGGHIDEGEDLLEALKREVKEECGLDLTEIKSVNETATGGKFLHHSKVYTPFCVNNYQEGTRINMAFICKAEGEFIQKGVDDARDPRWITLSNLKKMLEGNPDQFFTFDLAALKYYVQQKEAGKI